jgi:hypothetical protein
MDKVNYRSIKQDRQLKTYHHWKKINIPSNTEIGTETNELMSEHIAQLAEWKKPPKRLPKDTQIFNKK